MERLTELFTDEYGNEWCALVGCKEVCAHGWTEDDFVCPAWATIHDTLEGREQHDNPN